MNLSQTFYGNTIGEWGITPLIIFGAFVVGKILYWFTTNVVRRLTAKTETRLDDIVIDMVEEPDRHALHAPGDS